MHQRDDIENVVEDMLNKIALLGREDEHRRCTRADYSVLAGCTACRSPLGKQLAKMVESRRKLLAGLCLGCVKDGNYSRDAYRKTCSKHGLQMQT